MECECGLCATPAEMLAAVGSIALAQPLDGARAGGNIAEIVYHAANGCVVIIVTQPKV